MQTIQQQRAKFALDAVKEVAEQLTEKSKKEYQSYASALPFMIHANGLGQAAAFYRSKGKEPNDPHRLLYNLLSNWLTGENVNNLAGFQKVNQPFHKHHDLLIGITESDMHTYLAAQAEAMAFLEWVKRFADALIETKKDKSDETASV